MAQHKATYKGSFRTKGEDRYYIQVWEYRGQEYMVDVPVNCMNCSSDYLPKGSMSKSAQHIRCQESIDAKIDNPLPSPVPAKWTNEYEDELWEMMGFED